MHKTILAILLIVGSTITGRNEPDLSGRWAVDMDPDFRGNRGVVECNIRQTGKELVVKCGSGVEMKGEITARTATWRTPPMTKDELVAAYIAETNAAGTELEGRWTLTGGALNEKGKFHGKKQK